MAGTPTVYTSNQWRINVTFPNGEVALDNISWDKATGGDIKPANQKYTPGGMRPQIAVGGLRTRDDMTVERAWSDAMIAAWVNLDRYSGQAIVNVSLTPLKPNGVDSAGKAIVYQGVLGDVTRPDIDSGASNIETLKIVVSLNESISGGGL